MAELFKLKVDKPSLIFATDGTPQNVAVTSSGNVVVTEHEGTYNVSMFKSSGKKLRTFGTVGSSDGQFKCAGGVTEDDEGNIVITDRFNYRVQNFSKDGKFLQAGGRNGRGPMEFKYPVGIVYNPKMKNLFVVDCGNNNIQQIYPQYFIHRNTFGKEGSGDGEFDCPSDVAVDGEGNLYIADSGNNRIQVFTPGSEFVRTFGKEGSGEGELKWPASVAVDANNLLYVCENGNHRVSVFTTEGTFVTSFGTKGSEPGQFKFPHGVTLDKNGALYVCDSSNRVCDRVDLPQTQDTIPSLIHLIILCRCAVSAMSGRNSRLFSLWPTSFSPPRQPTSIPLWPSVSSDGRRRSMQNLPQVSSSVLWEELGEVGLIMGRMCLREVEQDPLARE